MFFASFHSVHYHTLPLLQPYYYYLLLALAPFHNGVRLSNSYPFYYHYQHHYSYYYIYYYYLLLLCYYWVTHSFQIEYQQVSAS